MLPVVLVKDSLPDDRLQSRAQRGGRQRGHRWRNSEFPDRQRGSVPQRGDPLDDC